MSKETEIRTSWSAIAKGSVAGWFARCLTTTLKVELNFECKGPATRQPYLFCLWHNRILGAAAATEHWLKYRPGNVLTSASHDGTMLATALDCFGLGAVRGSSSRRGAAALIELRKTLQKGEHVIITPDGPRGPVYQLNGGIVKLASVAQAPIVPIHVDFDSFWEFNSWDRFRLPKPLSKISVTFGKEIHVPKGLDEIELEATRKRVEQVMSRRLNTGK